MKHLEILACKWIIRRIEAGWGTCSDDYDPDCASCQATKCIEFLKRNIEIIK
jgi:hypothetical protein